MGVFSYSFYCVHVCLFTVVRIKLKAMNIGYIELHLSSLSCLKFLVSVKEAVGSVWT